MLLEEVKQKIYTMCDKINLDTSSGLLPMFSENDRIFSEGSSIYVSNSKFYYVIMERGKISKKYESDNIDDILYHLFEGITFSLACEYELKHRKKNEDSRKQIWQKQIELLKIIKEDFAKKCENEIKSILLIAPYTK